MCEIVENYAKEYAKEEALETARKLFEKGVDFAVVCEAVKVPEDVLKELYDNIKK